MMISFVDDEELNDNSLNKDYIIISYIMYLSGTLNFYPDLLTEDFNLINTNMAKTGTLNQYGVAITR